MNVTDKNFDEEVIKSDIPVLVEFWASWCVPCKMIEYLLNELEAEYNGKIKITTLNIDINRKIPRRFDLTGIPTFISFNRGEIVDIKIGAQTKEELKKMIQNILK